MSRETICISLNALNGKCSRLIFPFIKFQFQSPGMTTFWLFPSMTYLFSITKDWNFFLNLLLKILLYPTHWFFSDSTQTTFLAISPGAATHLKLFQFPLNSRFGNVRWYWVLVGRRILLQMVWLSLVLKTLARNWWAEGQFKGAIQFHRLFFHPMLNCFMNRVTFSLIMNSRPICLVRDAELKSEKIEIL